jgi:hypothetical protein
MHSGHNRQLLVDVDCGQIQSEAEIRILKTLTLVDGPAPSTRRRDSHCPCGCCLRRSFSKFWIQAASTLTQVVTERGRGKHSKKDEERKSNRGIERRKDGKHLNHEGAGGGEQIYYHSKRPLIPPTGPGATPSMSIAVTERVWRDPEHAHA